MSFTADYTSINLTVEGTVRDALQRVATAHGWNLIDNAVLEAEGKAPVTIRVHGSDRMLHERYDLVLQNPGNRSSSYDVGLVVLKKVDEETKKDVEEAVLTFDPYLGEVEKEWGKDCNGLRKETIIAAIQELSPQHIHDMSMEEVVANFATDPESGDPLTIDLLHDITQPIKFNTLDEVDATADPVSSF